MGAYALLFPLVISLFVGLSFGVRTITGQIHVQTDDDGTSRAQLFLAYKTGVQHYLSLGSGYPVTANSVSYAQAGLSQQDYQALAGGNYVTQNSSGATVVTWASSPSGMMSSVLQLTNGTKTIGVSYGSGWKSPLLGDMGPLPLWVPPGSIVSSVTLYGTGYSR